MAGAPDRSVTQWLDELRRGDRDAAQRLWERYYPRLVGLARRRLKAAHRRVADEEDVALSAFDSFCRGAAEGRFPRLADRDELWRLLVVITARKAGHLVRREGRLRRGGGAPGGPGEAPWELEQVLAGGPTPEFALQVAEEFLRLLGLLGDAELEAVAVWKMQGQTAAQIAERLGCVPRTVERKLRLIRDLWSDEAPR
jgi:DNA-directed RNA polymerase specialized sigma24 family protein